MDLLEMMRKRRSYRRYLSEPLEQEKIEQVLKAGLLSPSSRGIRPWELIVVQDEEKLKRLSNCRVGAANMLKGAACAIIVIADTTKSDVWIEDCAIVMSNMHLMADSLGIGSCWIQGRLRQADQEDTEDYVRSLLNFPEEYALEAILSLGMPVEYADAYDLEKLKTEKIHREVF